MRWASLENWQITGFRVVGQLYRSAGGRACPTQKLEWRQKRLSREFLKWKLAHWRLNIDSFRKSDFRQSQSFDKHVAIGVNLIFLALQSAQNSVSDFQPKQPGYRRDAIHRELACLQSFHWPEQGDGLVSLSQVTCVFCWRCNNHWYIRPEHYANAFHWE